VFDPLHVTIIEINRDFVSVGDSSSKPNKHYLPSFPGIPDEHFITDNEAGKGLITKREVRLAILSLLQPAPDDIGWDIGAGCGGVTVEWALWNPLGSVHAIEHHPKRLDCLQQNRDRFGVVDNLHIVAGRAPQALSELPAANIIFIGGSDGELPNMLQTLWQSLPLDGVIVASAVMETSRMQLLQFSQSPEFTESGRLETLQIAVSKGGELAGQLLYRPNLPVTLFKFTKTAGAASRHSD
jgi:precorrin-6Y C5,15-methyltransferase (decarboxylating)